MDAPTAQVTNGARPRGKMLRMLLPLAVGVVLIGASSIWEPGLDTAGRNKKWALSVLDELPRDPQGWESAEFTDGEFANGSWARVLRAYRGAGPGEGIVVEVAIGRARHVSIAAFGLEPQAYGSSFFILGRPERASLVTESSPVECWSTRVRSLRTADDFFPLQRVQWTYWYDGTWSAPMFPRNLAPTSSWMAKVVVYRTVTDEKTDKPNAPLPEFLADCWPHLEAAIARVCAQGEAAQ